MEYLITFIVCFVNIAVGVICFLKESSNFKKAEVK